MLQIEEIRTPEGLDGLEAEWAALQEASGRTSIFFSLPWFRICAGWPAPGLRPRILLAREDGRLVAVAPLAESRTKVRGFPLAEVTFLKTPLTACSDFLIDGPERLEPLLEHIDGMRWDRLMLDRFHETSPSRAAVEADFRRRGPVTETRDAIVPVLAVEGTWDDFLGSKSKNFRKARRKIGNRVDRLGDWTLVHATTPEQAGPALDDVLAVSAKGRKRLEGRDLLGVEYEDGLLRALTATAAAEGWLSIWLLKLGDAALAAEYHLVDGRTTYGLRAQFDHEYAQASPGTHLDTLIVKHLFDEGYEAYDMGPGALPYKLAWTDGGGYTTWSYQRYAGTLYAGTVRRIVESWIPAAKRFFRRSNAAG